MKSTLMIAAAMVAAAITPAHAAIIVNFDENGNGTWADTAPSPFYGGATSGLLSFAYTTDPTGSRPGNVLIYLLPELVISGAVDVGNPGDAIGSVDPSPSDVLFFTNAAGINDHGLDANLMIFYSQGGPALADVGLPAFAGTLVDITNENPDGSFQWLPDGPTFPNGNEYNGLSDDAPEPGSMILIGAGALALGMIRKRF
jgi:PEP-CTERM motif